MVGHFQVAHELNEIGFKFMQGSFVYTAWIGIKGLLTPHILLHMFLSKWWIEDDLKKFCSQFEGIFSILSCHNYNSFIFIFIFLFVLAFQKTSDRVRSQGSQSTTAQEFKEAMYAHSVYKYPYLVFNRNQTGNKVRCQYIIK